MVIVNNVFETPVFSNAFQHGVDVVGYSATKHIDGQVRVLGVVVLSNEKFIKKTLEPFMKHTGGAMSAFNAWIMLKGLETIELPVKAQAASALSIAEAVKRHEKAGAHDLSCPSKPSSARFGIIADEWWKNCSGDRHSRW